jgi:hypothetical protein
MRGGGANAQKTQNFVGYFELTFILVEKKGIMLDPLYETWAQLRY